MSEQDELERMRESEKRYRESKQSPKGSNETVKRYFDAISKTTPVEGAENIQDILRNLDSVAVKPRSRKPFSDFETAFEVFKEVHRRVKGSDLILNEYNGPVIENLLRWFICDPSSEYPLNKGIGLIGFYGIGKTHTFRCLQLTAKAYRIPEADFRMFTCPGIVKDVTAEPKSIVKFYTETTVFDDLGSEVDSVKNFGNSIGVMSDILFEREIRHENGGQITHFTSNAPPEELQKKYGERIFDRLQKITTLVVVKQKNSFRKP